MREQVYGPRRCRDSRKLPLEQCVKVNFYCCSQCGAIFFETGPAPAVRQLFCCGTEVRLLSGISLEDAQLSYPQVLINYKIVGGYNDNAVQIFWNQKDPAARPVWIYLKTFTGGYLKYLHQGKQAPMIFALADMDAFSYCDEDPCLECTFRCKRGFELYAYFEQAGLIQLNLDKMSPYWESK